MEKQEFYVPSTSKIPDNFKYISFVSESENIGEFNVATDGNGEEININCKFSGEEASHFYTEVISLPPSSLSSSPVVKQKSSPVVNKIVTKSESLSSLNNSRLTIFHYAQHGNIEGIKHCLKKNYYVDVQDMYGWTPLMCATYEGHYAAAEFLIKKGAKIDVKNKQGLTVSDIAVNKNHTSLIKLFKNGIVDEAINSEKPKKSETNYCIFCKCSYEETPEKHERSIAHLFSSKDSVNTSTYYYLPENNKGFQIMLKKGWNKNNGLGINASGRKFPIKTVLKTDRMCIGNQKKKSKITHFGPNDYRSVKTINQPSINLKKENRSKKLRRKNLESKNRQLEIEFRRQFHLD